MTRWSGNSAMVPQIEVVNRQRTVRLDLPALQAFAREALARCHRLPSPARTGALPSEIFVTLISDRRMAALHREFLHEHGPTDVITFQHGEIFISVLTARANATRFRTSTKGEIQLYIVHGLLHLRGWKDRTGEQARRMRSAEKAVLHGLV